jgi:hypothetical protein
VPFHVIINPEITLLGDDRADIYEGCLSLSGFSAVVPRAHRVRVAYLDEQGEPQSVDASGWYARILQHEIDHLQGMLYIDRMESRTFTSLDIGLAADERMFPDGRQLLPWDYFRIARDPLVITGKRQLILPVSPKANFGARFGTFALLVNLCRTSNRPRLALTSIPCAHNMTSRHPPTHDRRHIFSLQDS